MARVRLFLPVKSFIHQITRQNWCSGHLVEGNMDMELNLRNRDFFLALHNLSNFSQEDNYILNTWMCKHNFLLRESLSVSKTTCVKCIPILLFALIISQRKKKDQ